MTVTTADLRLEAEGLVEMARITEDRAETFHRDSDRDKYNRLLGQAEGLRWASEALTELLSRPDTEPRLWSVKS